MRLHYSARKVRTVASVVVALVLLASGVFIGNYTAVKRQQNATAKHNQQNATYSLLGQRILTESPSDILIDFKGLQNQIEGYLNDNRLSDKASVYFEYLATGTAIGINEDRETIGASLLKLPVVMTLYKEAENGKVDLDQKLPLQKPWLNSGYGNLYEKGVGYQLSLREAARYALEESDNTALLMIYDALSKAQNTPNPSYMGFVDANYAQTPTHEILIGSRSYSSILKCLYFACYANKDNSQEMLSYLAKSTATNRLTRYLPDDLTVAHKIGTFNVNGEESQSDCGIFYMLKRKYVLCVMVKEADKISSQAIADISRITYQYLATK